MMEQNSSTQNEVQSPVRSTETQQPLQRHIQAYLEGHVYHGRTGRKLDNG